MKSISSTQNNLIKQVSKLQEKSSERKKQGKFIIEGVREISLAIEGGYELEFILFCPTIFIGDITKFSNGFEIIEISKEVYEKIAYRKTTEGVIAIAQWKNLSLNDLTFSSPNPLILVAEGIEKPGNLGAILRTADAANIDAVFLANPKCDVYNPNVIRSSIGCVFTNTIISGKSEELIPFLHKKQINIYAATLQNSNDYAVEKYTSGTAIAVGSEANGLSEIWRKESKKNINIPMEGVIDSMNVSVSAAILIFEAKRQRKIN